MKAKFTQGSVTRHLVRVTLTNSISLLSLYVVDILALYWLARAGDPDAIAGVGLVSVWQFIVISLCLGLSTAVMTIMSRQVGAGRPDAARTVAYAGMIGMLALTLIVSLLLLAFADPALRFLGAEANVLVSAAKYLRMLAPAFVAMALGQICIYILLAHGQNNRAMIVVLSGTAVAVALDPILIGYAEMGLAGAASSYAVSRMVALATGMYFVLMLQLIRAAPAAAVLKQLRSAFLLALSTVLSNIAPGAAAAYVFSRMAGFGPDVLAGATVADRVLQLSFGTYFALPSAIAPILGQNLGAQRNDRVVATIRSGALLVLAFGLVSSSLLYAFSEAIASAFQLQPPGHDLVVLFCTVGGINWTLIGLQFVALPVFNVMGKPLFSAVANWTRASVGTVPFVLFGAAQYGASGVLVGQLVGNALVAILTFGLCIGFARYHMTACCASWRQRKGSILRS
ncbi:hypothetical protein D5038_04530 [Verminephrobacter aporrectodeae subsp. tuberculatae]|uniref:MATE family efflux transporter n=1 Tax=Verminephrobacter aporrectodeae TaxID=1110389 RepID=UPI002236F0C7|nr:MATE family efflux transporter [Verminephrobacter aporrectodeae]MCW5255649.1 hypothetical protein [Verminephrobacter aporrectodeae subsp. tuberculatae]